MTLKCNLSNRLGTKISVIILGGALCAIMLSYAVFGDNNDEHGLRNLRMISILFRHGDKSPSEFYPNDPHSSFEWPGGTGALSPKGSLQAYNLGKNLRMRYYRLLPKNGLYTKDEMLVASSYAERCLMSAQSVLAGFVPPLHNPNIPSLPILWQPIPVNSVPRLQDTLLAQRKPCAKYDEIFKKMYTNPPPSLAKLNKENEELYKKLTKHSGKNITNVLEVEFLYTTLKIEQDVGLTLPDWTENVYPDKMLPLVERSYTLATETLLMKKVKGGAFLTEILNKMLNKRRKNLVPDRKIFLYSGHDVTLVNVMNSLNILEQTANLPDYSSALVFELHHSSLFIDDFEVKLVYYFNSDDKFPKEIDIPKCDSPCSLTNFAKSIDHLIVENYDETCDNLVGNTSCKT